MKSIRDARPEDAAAMLAIYQPAIERTSITFEISVPSVEEFRQRFEKISSTHPWLVFESDGLIAGYAYASPHRERAAYQWTTEVSVYVAEGFHRQGIARALYAELFARLRRQGYFTALAGITIPNEASVALHEALGFRPVGVYHKIGFKLNSWHDVGWWSLPLGDYHLEPKRVSSKDESRPK